MANDTAREQLVKNGVVLSFRTSDRTVGKTHYRHKRTGKGKGAVYISKISAKIPPTHDTLKAYQPLSGFASVGDWLKAIDSVHGDVSNGYVYRIELLEADQ